MHELNYTKFDLFKFSLYFNFYYIIHKISGVISIIFGRLINSLANSCYPSVVIVLSYVAWKLHRTSASRFGTGIGIGTLWKLAESRFQNVSKIFSLKTCWKLTIPFWNHASVLKKKCNVYQ